VDHRGIRCAATTIGALAFVVTLAGTAAAQDQPEPDPVAEARAQYQLGKEAFTAKRYVEAAMHFEAAAAQRPHAVALYTAGLAWDQASRPERAADAYTRALEVPGLNAEQAAKARERIAQLEKTLGTLALMIPDTWKAQLDNFTEVTGPARLHAPPGAHVLTVRLPSKVVHRRDVALEAGQTVRLEIGEDIAEPAQQSVAKHEPTKEEPKKETKPEPAPEASAERAGERQPLRKTLGFVALGVGGAGLLSGIVLGTQALSAGDAYDAAPSREGYDHAQSLATWTTVSFIASGVFLAGGLALVLLPESGPASAKIGLSPAGATLRGSF
jgi:tetratricopeptide (TPR) repeat protein